MSGFADFLTGLLDHGRIVFRSAKAPRDGPDHRALAVLADRFEVLSLSVAGERIPLDVGSACAAAEVVRQSSWALVRREERVADLKRRLTLTIEPRTASQHLSVDLVLRYLPQVLKRARNLDSSDPMIDLLGDILRRSPLSGVLSDVEDGPRRSLDFGGHAGLLMLYGERLAGNDRAGWRPEPSTPAWEYYEWALQERSGSEIVGKSKEIRLTGIL